jgi:hypothetical protein
LSSMEMMGGSPQEDAPANESDIWQQVLELVRSAAEADGQIDPQEQVIVEQVTSLIAKLRAGRDKERQAALGGSPAMKYLSRQSG